MKIAHRSPVRKPLATSLQRQMTEEFKRELFLSRQFEVNSFQIGKAKLKASIDSLDNKEIVDIYIDKKGYEQLNFTDRLEMLRSTSGWIHYAGGVAFEINNGIINRVKLSARFLQNNKTSKKEIIQIFGEPDIELVDDILYSGLEYNIDGHVLVYRDKQIYAFIDKQTEILKELHFGTFDEKAYGKK